MDTLPPRYRIDYSALHARIADLIAKHGNLIVQFNSGFRVPATDANPKPSHPFGALETFKMGGCLFARTENIEEVLRYSEADNLFLLDEV